MKTVLSLLLLCLCDPGRSDCQSDCLSCTNVLPRQLTFNTMVCLIECEGNISPAFSWDFCRKALSSPLFGFPRKRSQEEVEALFPEEEEQVEEEEEQQEEEAQAEGGGGLLLLPAALHRLELSLDHRNRADKLNAAYNARNALSLEDEYEEEQEEEQEQEEAAGGNDDPAGRGRGGDAQGLSFSKRFGGFYKGRHGYRKLMAPGRSYQKRYGGFVGIRKSARKWNNQKRFGQFLKQYLGTVSTRASQFNGLSKDLLAQQNQI